MESLSQNRAPAGGGKIYTGIISLPQKAALSRRSRLQAADKKGLTLSFSKKSLLVPEREMYKFLNKPAALFLSHYELLFYGVIKEIRREKKGFLSVRIVFTKDTPLYYRECVEALLN